MTTHDEATAMASRSAMRRWLLGAARPYLGWGLAALGALSLFLGWYGVSGQSLTAKQLPYVVSGGLGGIALVVIAAVFLTTDDVRRQVGRLEEIERKVDDLYSLLVLDSPAEVAAPTASGVVALPTGSSFHLPSCALIAGKPAATAVDAATIAKRHLKPCRVCDPQPPGPAT